jgi:uncharacterized protein (DUF433 family)
MSRMKDLVMDILEDFENRIPVSVIAEKYEVSIEMVEEVVELYSEV